jgi:predicted nuclease of predicted toxin-antitoxin system
MKFLIDANLPFKLAKRLRFNGFDVLHTDELPNKERTSDKELREVSVYQNRIIVTKDSDFLDSHIVMGVPNQLLLITTGNITNKDLLALIEKNLETVVRLFNIYNLIELNNQEIVVHDK